MMNGYVVGIGLGWLWVIFILLLGGLAVAALVKDLRNSTKGNMVDYTINRLVKGGDFDAVDARTRAALSANGFGVLTEIDVKATMKYKLNADMPDYRILGACNPKTALKAIGMEPRIGAMLPCNVILREVEGGVVVSAVDPVVSMQAIDNSAFHSVAGQVRDMLAKAVAEI